MHRKTQIIALGMVPPPVTGKAVATQKIFEELRSRAAPDSVFINLVLPRRGWRSIIGRSFALFSVLVQFIRTFVKNRRIPIYIVAEGGAAIAFTALYVTILRSIASPLVIHHHGRFWLEHSNIFLKRLIFDRSFIQVTQCQTMSNMVRAGYGGISTGTITNAFLVEPTTQGHFPGKAEIVLAHLSNLTLEKGLDQVIQTFEALKLQGLPVALRIGGTPQDGEAERVLSAAMAHHPEIDWRGFVDPESKDSFFANVTAFLFPTRYKMETEGIVVLEAMSRSIPVIATDLCCLKDNLAGSGGVALSSSANFVPEAVSILKGWFDRPLEYGQAANSSFERFKALRAQSLTELEWLYRTLGVAGCKDSPTMTDDVR